MMGASCRRCGASFATELTRLARPLRASSPSPLLTIWIRPRETVRRLAASDPTTAVIVVAWLSGMVDTLQTSAMKGNTKAGWGPFVVGMAVLAGPLFGFAHFCGAGRLLAMIGGWLGGRSDVASTRMALAWGSVPEVAGLALWIPALASFGEELFMRETPSLDGHPWALLLMAAFFLLQGVLYVWSWVLKLAALAEIQGISAGRAFWAIVLAWMIPILTLFGTVLAFVSTHGK